MSEGKYLKCTCAQCAGHIEFPADGIGQTVPCPHCGWPTELMLAVPPEASARSARSMKWIVAGAVILIVGIVGVAAALAIAQKQLRKGRDERMASRAKLRAANANTTAVAAASSRPANLINDFSVSEAKILTTPGSTLVYASGTLKNETDKQRFGVTVEMDLLDSAGKKIGTAKDYRDTIEPRNTWVFRALLVQKGIASAHVISIREQH